MRYSEPLNRLFKLTPKNKNVLKASFAYFVATLFTFIPFLRNLLGDTSTHLAATAIIFFNPARRLGAFLEGCLYGIIGLAIGGIIAWGSCESASILNGHQHHTASKLVSIIVFCGGGTFIIAYLKAKFGKPTVNTGASIAYITLYAVLIKQTSTFLLDANLDSKIDIQTAMQAHRQSFAALKASLSEAHLEFFNWKVFGHLNRYNAVVKSLNRLTQHLGSMSSGIKIQENIVKTRFDSHGPSVKNLGPAIEDDPELEQEVTLSEFTKIVGPALRSLTYTAKETILVMQNTFGKSSKRRPIDEETFAGGVDFSQLQQNLHQALKDFEKSQNLAVAQIYQQRGVNGKPNENVFIVYFFVFSLQEFTKELIHLVGAVQDLEEEQRGVEIEQRKYVVLSWWVRRMWKKIQRKAKTPAPSMVPQFSDALGQHDSPPTKLRHKLTTQLWGFFSWFRQFEVKFAIKTAVSAMVLSIPAFIDEWRTVFRANRGEWALISMAVILVPTVGASNVVGVYRVLCNFLGGFLAGAFYYMFSETTFLLPFMVFLISIPCWHLFLNTNFPRVGQFTLLTFNVILLNKVISLEDDDDIDIFLMAFHRAIAVSVGVTVGLFVTSYIWPYEARSELRKGLSDFFRDTSKLYQKLIAVYSTPMPQNVDSQLLSSTQRKNKNELLENSRREFMELEFSLQISLLNLHSLLLQTPNEPRLKGPFPQVTYTKILSSCQLILDRLLALRTAVTKKEWFQLVQEDFLLPTSRERRRMAGSILLYLYVISSGFKLKSALPPYLPPAAEAHHTLVEKIRDLDSVKSGKLPEEADSKLDYVYYYAYVVSIEEFIRELDTISGYMYLLFGCEGGTAFQHYTEVQT
ncbi:hypothetical protein K493DRAFT_202352 [Basidiobolus meristosporus CBS 931.73]|uniref:Uncharacterized protein n=1 Tax=Basidiobolus meristosporus CBS 931.73 TaxID=1314790 RepID=A0A1Y1ZA95_9FUNG|nr:hypothetical protein K493DRAFT_202352 [Basidiobolus meristosporus CBS 931.73]|eukprot:ORY07223.1 hypothetical protein K493DRAFT_202352 [Basidiobolus meristosporus CBS 931.73]